MIMKNTRKIPMIVASVLVAIFALIHILDVVVQTYIISIGDWVPAIDWSVAVGLKLTIVALRAVAMLALVVMLVIFVRNIVRAKSGLFVSANVSLLFWAMIPYLCYAFCESNIGIISGDRYVVLTSGMMLGAGLLLLISLLYRRATMLAEESSLTI
jgi:hypothetical protein